jgi:haloalkane dehalogenase
MWDLAKSVLSFSWAMSLFGLQQMANLFAPSGATKGFQDLTRAAEAELNNPLKSVFQAGDALQKGFVDYTRGALTGQAFDRSFRAGSAPVSPFPGSTHQEPQPLSGMPPQWAQPDDAAASRPEEGWGPMPKARSSPAPPPVSPAPVQFPSEPDISPEFPYEPHYVNVLGSQMHYIEQGTGDPILLLHGNPTWSYLWRNIIPHLSHLGRCIAPDLIGYGRSGKPEIEYRWFDHAKYLEKFIEALDLKDITLVLHDHGSGLGFHYAMNHQDNVRAIAFFEAIVRPFPAEEFSSPEFREIFRKFRSGEVGGEGWQLLVEQNMFIEQLLPQAAGRPLTPKEMGFYREPFPTPQSRIPIWKFARETPIGGEPPDVWDAVSAYSEKLQRSQLPKLMLYVTPGALLTPVNVEWCKRNIINLQTVYVGQGLHFLQESIPHRIGREIAGWCENLHAFRKVAR